MAVAFTLFAHPSDAQHTMTGPTGLWLTRNHGAVVAIMPCDGRLCGRIVGVVLDHPTDAMPVDYRGLSQCGLELINDAHQIQSGVWKGHILDPRNGDVFGVEIRLDAQDRLALRGFVGIPLLGRTEVWTRYGGSVPPDCRLLALTSTEPKGQAKVDSLGSTGTMPKAPEH